MSWLQDADDTAEALSLRSFRRAEDAFEGREHPDFHRPEDLVSDEGYEARLDRLVGAREDGQR
jgi:hypothetical protein